MNADYGLIVMLHVAARFYAGLNSAQDKFAYFVLLVCTIMSDIVIDSGYPLLAVALYACCDVVVWNWVRRIRYRDTKQKILVALTVGLSVLLSHSIHVAAWPTAAYYNMFFTMLAMAAAASNTGNYGVSLFPSASIVLIAWEEQWHRWPFFALHGILAVVFYVAPQVPSVMRVNTVRLRRELTEDKYV
jgi:hypothetical protein